ncbi:MAG: sulfate adenylyltransferase subunit CysN, partial [Fimbriimonadaceae bacterium]|nr:sulfate adenylyltransferase subunit CysN [Alphaproteobacteria bacterium]
EREQGITIDVAYRFFTTERRKFIVADTPGHEQYTRNMATGASNSDLAIILVDARHGMMTQTRRHSFITSLLGIRHVVLAVNKIDLVDFAQHKFDDIRAEYQAFADSLGFESITAIPMSARYGDNVTSASKNISWYTGPTLLDHLETIEIDNVSDTDPFRMPVQWVNRPNLDFRGFSGTIASGTVAPGSDIVVAKSGQASRIRDIVTFAGNLETAGPGEAVTLTLEDEIDISRGDMIVAPDARPDVADQFVANIIWMAEDPMFAGRQYLLKSGAKTVVATITEIKHKIDVNTFEHLAGKTVELNEIAVCNVSLADPIAFDPYRKNQKTGAFILIDRFSNATVAAGMITHGLR